MFYIGVERSVRIQQINYSKQGLDKRANIQLQPGQIVRGKVLRLFPLDRAHIQLGSHTFIAQLEAPLEHGKSYYFQVAHVEKEIHLQVIQQPIVQGENEWQQLLDYIGSKHSKVREDFIKQLLESNIPFTKRTLQQVFALLESHSRQKMAMDVLKQMMERQWPLTKEIMESLIMYHSSTFTKEIKELYQSLSQPNHVARSNHLLIQQLERLLPEATKANEVYKPLYDWITTKDARRELQFLQMISPQINNENLQLLKQMSFAERALLFSTPNQMLDFLGIRTPEARTLLQQILTSISTNRTTFQKQVEQFIETWERNLQLQTVRLPNRAVDKLTHQRIQDSFMGMISMDQSTQSLQPLLSHRVPTNVHELLQMMIHLKEMNVRFIQQMTPQLEQQHQSVENKQNTSEFIRAIQHIVQDIGLSYEHSIAQGETDRLTSTLKGLLMQFIQEQGVGVERVRPLLQFIQGMQLQAVQETAHMLSLHIQIPAMLGAMQSDMHLQFESKKTAEKTIDPNYCRVLFDLHLKALDQVFIDMHIQNKQVSFIIYNDFPYIKQIAGTFEPTLRDNLSKTGYDVSSIRYLPLSDKKKKADSYAEPFDRPEGFDIKI